MTELLDVVIVGAGQAGLGMGYLLGQDRRSYIIFERGKIGHTWRSQRWDSFALNTPNWANVLPGLPYAGDQPDGFWNQASLVDYFEQYAEHHALRIRTGTSVVSVTPDQERNNFLVAVRSADEEEEEVRARCVIVASGILNVPNIPAMQKDFPPEIAHFHTGNYRNPAQLPEGAILVVGSGQSGCQIAEDLLGAGRKVYLCTSKVGRLPRRYRGREVLEWWTETGFWAVSLDDLADPAAVHMRQPQISGVGRYGHTLSLQQLARDGAVILGRLDTIRNGRIHLQDNAAEHVAFADALSARLKQDIDDYISANGIEAPHVPDPADAPDSDFDSVSDIDSLDLDSAGIGSVIWATGFRGNFDWLKVSVLDAEGQPMHRRGVAHVPGIYFLGFPWLYRRNSGVIYGIESDGRYILDHIKMRLDQ